MDTSFAHPLHHLRAELARLDRLIQREILRLRAGYQLSQEELRGLYISNEQVDALANEAAFPSRDGDEPPLRRLRQEAPWLLERNPACRRSSRGRISPPNSSCRSRSSMCCSWQSRPNWMRNTTRSTPISTTTSRAPCRRRNWRCACLPTTTQRGCPYGLHWRPMRRC